MFLDGQNAKVSFADNFRRNYIAPRKSARAEQKMTHILLIMAFSLEICT
jgi:hypothetical protein